ncbi:MAG: hypothetical protein Q7R72_01510 [bacterium]|nr:hypothetical protein [bacterium]
MKTRSTLIFSAIMLMSASMVSTADAQGIGLTYVYAGENNEKTDDTDDRSIVADFVQSLLDMADRDGGIGSQVREIANKQDDSATTTRVAIAKVGERGPVRELFFGSDYKNLGIIRSELATTTNNIARLKSLVEKTTNDADRAELNIQIKVLESEQTKIKVYVEEHESIFSFFGWFTKLFAE